MVSSRSSVNAGAVAEAQAGVHASAAAAAAVNPLKQPQSAPGAAPGSDHGGAAAHFRRAISADRAAVAAAVGSLAQQEDPTDADLDTELRTATKQAHFTRSLMRSFAFGAGPQRADKEKAHHMQQVALQLEAHNKGVQGPSSRPNSRPPSRAGSLTAAGAV